MVTERRFTALKLPASRAGESGQTLVEYSLIIALIAVAAIFVITVVAGDITSLWGWIGTEVTNAVDKALG